MLKIFIIIVIVIIMVVIGFFVLNYINSRPVTKKEAKKLILETIENDVVKNKTVTSVLVGIKSTNQDFSESFVAGESHGIKTTTNQPFHIASVGKTFTATIIAILAENGQLNFDDAITTYLSDEILTGLFIFEGIDYKEEVTIHQLLNHTSGIGDYFDDPVIKGSSMHEMVLDQPDHQFEPLELVDFTREKQNASARPGEVYHYSDTGYILIGLIIESITEKSFDENLHELIFEPLSMNDSYLMFYSEPKNPAKEINELWFDGVEIHDYQSVSVDWAGGGIVSTLEDLSKFSMALNHYQIVSEKTLNKMYEFDYKFIRGIYYGLGVMEYRFEEYFPTLVSLPHVTGHMGILGTHMLYDKESDMTIIVSYGSTEHTSGSIKSIIKILSILNRIQ